MQFSRESPQTRAKTSHTRLLLLFKHRTTMCQTSLMQSNYLFPVFILIFLSSNYLKGTNFLSFLFYIHMFSISFSISAHLTKLFSQYRIIEVILYMFKTAPPIHMEHFKNAFLHPYLRNFMQLFCTSVQISKHTRWFLLFLAIFPSSLSL